LARLMASVLNTPESRGIDLSWFSRLVFSVTVSLISVSRAVSS
jgi:hypothetical protein